MDVPAFPGGFLLCRIIGVIEGEQTEKGKKTLRNDRIIAIQQDTHSWNDVKTANDFGDPFCKELEQFFMDYHKLSKTDYKVLALKGPARALKLIKAAKR
jgi:inorganic pyrophosphatase